MKKVVTIGGGTGSYTLLTGLKKYNIDISAIVNMVDNGGSTGKLRDELGDLPVGDLRRCLIALSEETDFMRKLFTYRFGEVASGHSLGNLLLTALTDITGDLESALSEAEKLLNTKGKVIPSTLDDINICAVLENGQVIEGETNIDVPKHNGDYKIKEVYLKPKAFSYYKANEAIENADMIIIGPGDLYTSIIPNLLVKGISESIKESKAKKIYVCNIMTKYGETNNYCVHDFYEKLRGYLCCDVDVILYNSKKISSELEEKYAEQKQHPVVLNGKEINEVELIGEDLLSETDIARHDPQKLGRKVMEIYDYQISSSKFPIRIYDK